MRLRFLGTSAANAYPQAFCKCENCQRARELGGPNLRKRSAALVNDDLLIDFGPDIMTASQIHNIALTEVRYCLQTHFHTDHLDLSHLLSRSPGYGIVGADQLQFYASGQTLEQARLIFEGNQQEYDLLHVQAETILNLRFHRIEPFQTFRAGDYRIMAFPANHAPGWGALLFAIESNGRSLFYGTDTAVFLDEVWQALRKYRWQFDLVVLDHTHGFGASSDGHMNAEEVRSHVKRLREEKILKEHGRALATHFSHQGNPVHQELVKATARFGYEIAYDGLEVHL